MNPRISALIFSCCALFSLPLSAAELYFPPHEGEWERVAPESVGWDAALLSQALDVAGERNSSGVVILYGGRLLAERYWDGPDNAVYQRFVTGADAEGNAIEDVASAQKSIVAILTGMAQERGFLDLDDSVSRFLGDGWSKASAAQEEDITIRHLLSMTSGLATDFTFSSEPGTQWLYNTPVYHTTMRVLMAATGMERNDLTVEWISEPIGAKHTSWTPRPWADADIAVGLSTTARDLARFGLMIQAGGTWNGEVVIADTNFLQEMLSPSQSLNPAYGYLWWLNGQDFALDASGDANRNEGMLIPDAPHDLVAMQGAGDRKLYLVPGLNLVIARLGFTGSRPRSSFNDAFWQALQKAAP